MPRVNTSQAHPAMINLLRTGLAALANPNRAIQQQAYMKTTMPFAGVGAPDIKKMCREVFKEHPPDNQAQWLATARTLWDEMSYREERYIAIQLLATPRFQKRWLTPVCLPLLRDLIQSGAWWDLVDALAINHVGRLLATHESEIKPILRKWIDDEDLWIRRTTILVQLKFKADTDLIFLNAAIHGSIDDPDFFSRKAIGWALRELSKTKPDWVLSYIDQHKARLSGLSVREGLKVLKKGGRV